ncbi:MAG TPA: sigma-70 family RNA polymerase sigma factor [Terriglobales bacterium]|nr:sigma-70 family RNA polymerase sigma factor [Terriglobales bacterium]
MELFSFDRPYLERLRAGDPATEGHFVSYFSDLVLIKLRARYLAADAIEDIRQETFLRVLTAIRKDGGVQQPERLGAFVNSVCNNILLEHYRSSNRHEQADEDTQEIPDKTIDLDGQLISEQAQSSVRQVLERLSRKDQDLIRAVLLDEGNKDQICQSLGIDRDYLRVLVHRAKQNFKSCYEKTIAAQGRRVKTL